MRPLAALERFLERLFERPSARLFRTRLQPVQVQRRIERAMETERLSGADRTLVPNRFRVHLASRRPRGASATWPADARRASWPTARSTFARAHRYAPRRPAAGRPRRRPDDAPRRRHRRRPFRRPRAAAAGSRRATRPTGRGQRRRRSPDRGRDGPTPPADERARASSRSRSVEGPARAPPRGPPRRHAARGRHRRPSADDRAGDRQRARPARLPRLAPSRPPQARHGVLVLTDLGSTNGSRVNGIRVAEVGAGRGRPDRDRRHGPGRRVAVAHG